MITLPRRKFLALTAGLIAAPAIVSSLSGAEAKAALPSLTRRVYARAGCLSDAAPGVDRGGMVIAAFDAPPTAVWSGGSSYNESGFCNEVEMVMPLWFFSACVGDVMWIFDRYVEPEGAPYRIISMWEAPHA